MSDYEFILIVCAFIFAGYFTKQFISDLKRGIDSILKKIFRWLKNLFDSFAGLN